MSTLEALRAENESLRRLLREAQRQQAPVLGQRLHSAIFDRAMDAMLLIDEQGAYVDANPAACALLGLPLERLLGRKAGEFVAPGYDLGRARQQFQGQGRLSGIMPLLRADGEVRMVDFASVLDVTPGIHLSIMRDATAREEMARAHSYLAAVVEGSTDAIIGKNIDGIITAWNHAAEKLFGYRAGEILGQSIQLLVPPELVDEENELRQRVFMGSEAEQIETVRLHKDGHKVEVSMKLSPIHDPDGATVGVSIFARDLTPRRLLESRLQRAEAQLLAAQKMEAIGQLAGSVAHDFNNLLSVILSVTDMMLETPLPDESMRDDIEEIARAGQRASDLTRQLLAFSRQQVLQPRVLDVNMVVLGMERMLRRLLGEGVDFSLLLSPRAGRIVADPGQLEQVVMNLCVNARDAMPLGGKLTIETSFVSLEHPHPELHDMAPGSYSMLSVSDTGVGMSGEVRQRIFEPFFSTKESGKGTGLGLATVFGIVKQSGGHIWVGSEPGKGTTFKVYFPRTEQPSSPMGAHTLPPHDLRGNETVLVVEDEEQVRAVMRAILRRSGYNVLEAQNGGEAFLISEQFEAQIDLLLTDVMMPRMTGQQLADRLLSQRPGMRVLYVSGYTENSFLHHGVLEPGIAFLPKPISPDVLLRKVREVLSLARHQRPGSWRKAASLACSRGSSVSFSHDESSFIPRKVRRAGLPPSRIMRSTCMAAVGLSPSQKPLRSTRGLSRFITPTKLSAISGDRMWTRRISVQITTCPWTLPSSSNSRLKNSPTSATVRGEAMRPSTSLPCRISSENMPREESTNQHSSQPVSLAPRRAPRPRRWFDRAPETFFFLAPGCIPAVDDFS